MVIHRIFLHPFLQPATQRKERVILMSNKTYIFFSVVETVRQGPQWLHRG
jgi:hypothetical protein